MKVFISYGHDCASIVGRIAKDLNANGHEAWMDYDKIYSGADWRNEITEGIIRSQAVILFISSHSLRPGSVCYDEISISVSCNSVNTHIA